MGGGGDTGLCCVRGVLGTPPPLEGTVCRLGVLEGGCYVLLVGCSGATGEGRCLCHLGGCAMWRWGQRRILPSGITGG